MKRIRTRLRAQAAVSSAFTPLSLPNLLVWYDAGDTSTITATSGLVDQMNDKSGLGNHATATFVRRPTTGTRTVNSLNALDFDGSTNVMDIPAGLFPVPNGANTMFMVTQLDVVSATSQVHIFLSEAGSGRYSFNVTTNNMAYRNRTDTTSNNYVITTNTTAPHIYGFRRSGASIIPFYDGVQGADVANAQSESGINGASLMAFNNAGTALSPVNGLFCSLIICTSSLSNADTNLAGNYLKDRFGAAWTNI
jgi:hypothetical protein